MEGLIPLVYRAIVQYRSGEQAPITGAWLNESSSASYMRLPGDSGRIQSSEIQLFGPDLVFSSSSPSSTTPFSTSQLIVSSSTQSPLRRLISS